MVNFRSKKWFDAYIAFRKKNPLTTELPRPEEVGLPSVINPDFESPKHPLYAILQNSGLAYGFPVQYPFQPNGFKRMNSRKKAKFILIDTLIYAVFTQRGWKSDQQMAEKIDGAADLIRTYYRGMNRFAPQKDEDIIEKLLMQRISFKRSLLDFRRSGINSHLFWDLYFFQEYLIAQENPTMREEQIFENLFWRKKKMKIQTMQIIAAAIHSDRDVSKGEKVLQHQFKKSAQYLTKGEKDRLQKQLKDGISLDYIKLPKLEWIGRRYLLDIALLALFADKEFNKLEQVFLDQLAAKLELTQDDINESKFDLGCFLMQFGRRLNFYNKTKNNLVLISHAVGANMNKLTTASKLEYEETVDMAATFGKLLQAQLGNRNPEKLPSEEEIAYALEQIKDLPKFLPFFTIMFMPVPGITELYILLAVSIEKLTGNSLRLLPSQFSKIVKGK